jgi:hypothetical protein
VKKKCVRILKEDEEVNLYMVGWGDLIYTVVVVEGELWYEFHEFCEFLESYYFCGFFGGGILLGWHGNTSCSFEFSYAGTINEYGLASIQICSVVSRSLLLA